MTETAGDQLNSFLQGGDKAIWTTAAVVLAIRGAASEEEQTAAQAVLTASGLDGVASLGAEDPGGVAARAAAPIHQAAALLRGEGQMWAAQSDEALLAQRRASPQGAAGFTQLVMPMLASLQETFADGARMLDVGTGVAAMAVAYAELFPQLTVVGIDVMPRVLALAEQTVAASSVSDRIILRQQDVISLDEPETYAFCVVAGPRSSRAGDAPGRPTGSHVTARVP